MTASSSTSLVLLLRRAVGTSADDFHGAWTRSRLHDLESPLVMRHEHFATHTDEERDGSNLPQFAEPGYDGMVFISVAAPDQMPELLASSALVDAVSDIADWADPGTSHALVTRDRIAFGPGTGEVVTLGCLRRHQHQTWPDFDERWLAHTRLTDGLRDSGLLWGYVQSHLSRSAPTGRSFRAGDLDLAWAPWDGVTRGFWVNADALARRAEMGEWLAECAEDERQFIDHARSCHHLTRRTMIA